jgi:membrane protease YdiL (CAAX protease family)
MKRQSLLENHSVIIFFVLTYSFSWLIWMPMVLANQESRLLLIAGTFGPTSVALLLTGLNKGWNGLKELLRRLLIWRVNIFWYLFSFFATMLVVMASIGIHVAMGGAVPQFNDPRQIYLVIPVFAYVLFLSVLGEEIGWRGYVLPRLQHKYGALVASLIIGVMWGMWHLPEFLIENNFHRQIPFILFLLQDIALSIVLTWLYNSTKKSLLIVNLFHAASNTTIGVLPILPMDTGGDLRPLWIAVDLLWIVAAIIVIANKSAWLTHRKVVD